MAELKKESETLGTENIELLGALKAAKGALAAHQHEQRDTASQTSQHTLANVSTTTENTVGTRRMRAEMKAHFSAVWEARIRQTCQSCTITLII